MTQPGSLLTWYRAKRARAVVVLAHGAGAGQKHPWMVKRAEAWAARGVDVATFDFGYMAAGRKYPDKPAVLEERWRQAIAEAGGPVIAAGKSMGGRIATQVAAQGEAAIVALVTLGYPLHPPGEPAKLRVAHLAQIRVPWLAVQGERDTFGGPEELRPYLPKNAELLAVAGGDHSLSVPKKMLQPNIDDAVVRWMLDL